MSLSGASQLVDVTELRACLVRAVGRLCPSWLGSQREDLVQASVMRVMRMLERPPIGEEQRTYASSYLYKVAYTALVDEIRRVRRRRETDLDDATVQQATTAAPDPERAAASAEVGRGIQACLSNMIRDRRLAVILYLQGHTVAEAARILDWPFKRTENLVYRGLADLRTCLAAKGLQP